MLEWTAEEGVGSGRGARGEIVRGRGRVNGGGASGSEGLGEVVEEGMASRAIIIVTLF